jgi:hypothetical protein
MMINWKGFVGSVCGLILRYYPGIHMQGLRKTMKNLNQDSWSPALRFEAGTLKYKAVVLATRPRRLAVGGGLVGLM